MGFHLKEALQSLCCSNGWSYAVVWRLKCHDSMLLIPVDAYCDVESGMVVDQVLHQVHVVGEGIIGQVALTGKHRWIFSDTYCGELSTVGSTGSQTFFQDTAEWSYQFSAGVKTVAVISVSSQRVIQFGSNQKIPESLKFVDHTRSFFHQLQSVLGASLFGTSEKPIDSEICDRTFASLVSSGNYYSNYANVKPIYKDSCKELTATAVVQSTNRITPGLYQSSSESHTLTVPVVSSSTSATKATASMNNSSFHLLNHCQTAGANAQVIFSTPNMPLPQVLPQSNSSSANNSVLCNSSMSELSTYEFMEQQLLSGIGVQGASNLFPTISHINVPMGNKFCDFQVPPFSNPSYRKNGSPNTINYTAANTGYGGKKLADSHQASPLFRITEGKPSTSSDTFLGELKPDNAGSAIPSLNSVNHLNQSSGLPLEQVNTGFTAQPSNDLLQMASSLASDLVGGDVFDNIPVNNLCSSIQDLVAGCRDSRGSGSSGKQSTSNVPLQLPVDNGLFDGFGLDHRQSQGQKFWDDIILPGGIGDCSNLSTGVSECISALDSDSLTACEKGFFSDRGLEQLLDAVVGNAKSISNPNSSDQSSTSTVTRAGSSYVHSDKVPFVGLSSLNSGMDGFLPKVHSAYGPKKEVLPKSLVSSWIDSSNNISAESAVISQPKKPEDPSKITRKRARPGESTRPRPKDRQQIQDRVKELREIVPNGAKCSIDALLDRTIKHMLFLQSVTKYADKLKQTDEPKMIGEASSVVLKDNSSGNGGGSTFAFEVGGQTMVCPIIVEDLHPPGQMLVEMLCEERGFFLEIADIIRGFGLTILKGVMEVRDDKVWARFVVEVNRDITRMDIFMSLVKLLPQTMEASIGSSSQTIKVIDNSIPVFTNYQQSPLPHPISLADRLQ
ncbi:hypothetical protein AAC387_Pa06g0582 [Persea americana]